MKPSGPELPDAVDAANLVFKHNVAGKSRVTAGAVVCRKPNGSLFASDFRELSVTDLG